VPPHFFVTIPQLCGITQNDTCGGVAKVIPVDVSVPGCPPPPLEILRGILTAVRRGRKASA